MFSHHTLLLNPDYLPRKLLFIATVQCSVHRTFKIRLPQRIMMKFYSINITGRMIQGLPSILYLFVFMVKSSEKLGSHKQVDWNKVSFVLAM